MKMYDNLRLLCRYPFQTADEMDTFAARFGLYVFDKNKGILHNSGYDTLEQNRGVYINVTLPTESRKGKVLINVSLHKFANATQGRGLQNYNDFTFTDAKAAAADLAKFLGLNLHSAQVKKYETGINVQTAEPPELYMRELESINIVGKPARILEDLNYKEYAQFSTSKEKNKRVVYIWYNKSVEATTKQKKPQRRATIPKNILRLEKDVKRPDKRIFFSDLFKSTFIAVEKKDFAKKFTTDTNFKTYPKKSKNISAKQLTIYKQLQSIGLPEYEAKTALKHKRGEITRRQKQYSIKLARELFESPPAVEYDNALYINALKKQITEKLDSL